LAGSFALELSSTGYFEKGNSEMQKGRLMSVISVGLLVALAVACKFSASTANISSLKISKDKAASAETSTFGPNDTVYAVATISNSPGKIKVKGHVVSEDAPNDKLAETTVDLPSSGTATFTFTPPASGFPAGKYKIEVAMLNEDGEQKDQKSATFTVQ